MPRAPRRCSQRDCDERVPCPTHPTGPWTGSSRRAELPSNWNTIRRNVLRQEPDCQLAYTGTWPTRNGDVSCTGASTEVDHINDPNDHSRGNLRGVCSACHRRRTQAQANGLPTPRRRTR